MNPFVAALAMQILEIIDLLHLIGDILRLLAAQYVMIDDLVDFLFALGARIFHLNDPLLDAWMAVLVRARV